jgi:hypothetical protein
LAEVIPAVRCCLLGKRQVFVERLELTEQAQLLVRSQVDAAQVAVLSPRAQVGGNIGVGWDRRVEVPRRVSAGATILLPQPSNVRCAV